MVEKIQSYFDIDPQLFHEKKKKSQLLLINIANLNGIQPPEEYSESKNKKIEELYRAYQTMGNPAQLTRDFPIICCAVPNLEVTNPMFEQSLAEIIPDTEYNMAIIDGHHRVRYGPKYGVCDFYCSVNSLSQTLLNIKKLRKLDCQVAPEEYYRALLHGMSTTIEGFAQKGHPHSIIPMKLA